ncbi:MAG TPA: amidinotransferase [Bacteroidetes bacterium]|nr:amidinotransferase [Bacteroidota bacterium]
MVIPSLSEVSFTLNDLPDLPRPERVLMTSPEHFDVQYVINAHMAGNVGSVDREQAQRQWDVLKSTYESCGLEVEPISGQAGLPDMVFCANQTLPFVSVDGNTKGVVLSNMFAAERAKEVQFFADHFSSKGYEIIRDLSVGETEFEGMGDALWHIGKRLLWGGYGFRTDLSAYKRISEQLDVPILALNLEDPEFYHLDTCMCLLDADTVLIFPGAFDWAGLELIHHFFPNVLEAPEDEARGLFACNAHCPDGRHVIIQKGCTKTNALLTEAGFQVVEVDTSEYLKSGGSVFCMKLMIW